MRTYDVCCDHTNMQNIKQMVTGNMWTLLLQTGLLYTVKLQQI